MVVVMGFAVLRVAIVSSEEVADISDLVPRMTVKGKENCRNCGIIVSRYYIENAYEKQ